MATLIGGLVSLYTKDQVILGVRQSMVNFGTLNWLAVPRPVWLLVVVAVAYLLRYTAFGRQLLSIGSNPRAATLVGIRVPLVVLLSFVVTGALAALAGELELARTGQRRSPNRLRIHAPGPGNGVPRLDDDPPGPVQRSGDDHRRVLRRGVGQRADAGRRGRLGRSAVRRHRRGRGGRNLHGARPPAGRPAVYHRR
jgi:Branched-chain amino acid transport system / permease component